MTDGIELIGLTKDYGDFRAVNHLDLTIPRGRIFGFLGPNGAGKTTTIKMMSTILPPTEGRIRLHGFELPKQRNKVKEIIGYCPQDLVLYNLLTARENINLIAQMHNLLPADYKERTDELLGQMKLLDRADDNIKKYSGGMKRRVNILMAVIHDPEIIFFDEPSAGLDPQSRRVVWDFIRDFEREKKTVILTTHNMEEADDLSDELVIIDHGKIIAKGSPQALKGKIGEGDVIEFKLLDEKLSQRDQVVSALNENTEISWAKTLGKERVTFSAMDGLRKIAHFYDFLEGKFGFKMQDVVIRQNTLEDVFIKLTGRELRE